MARRARTRMAARVAFVVVVSSAAMLVGCRPSTPPADHDASSSAEAGASPSASGSEPAGTDGPTDAAPPDTPLPDAASSDTGDAAPATSAGGARSADGGRSLEDAIVREARVVSLDESSNGKTFDLARGQMLVVMLAASPTSGFDWAVVKAPPALGEPLIGYVEPSGDAMGLSGRRRFTWKLGSPLPAGEHAVELAYRRGFEKGVAPLKTYRFKVRAAH